MKVFVAGILGAIMAISNCACAQTGNEKVRSPQHFLQDILNIAQSDDLANYEFLGKKLGLTFQVQPEKDVFYPGRDKSVGRATEIQLIGHDEELFGSPPSHFHYRIFQPVGKKFQRVQFDIPLNTNKFCVTADDFLAVFGKSVRRSITTDGGPPSYAYDLEQKNRIRVSGLFRKCMLGLSLSQNTTKKED